jgi:hypothetical protein
MLKKALQTNPRDVSPAVMRERTAALVRKKCLRPHAHRVAVRQEFLFSRETIVLFIAAIASPDRDKFLLDIRTKRYTRKGVSFLQQHILTIPI